MRARYALWLLSVFLLGSQLPLAAKPVQVNSANPNAAAQGTINLDVAVGGDGFAVGATAQWFVTGTTNPGGVTVNSTTFVSSTQLTASITVAADADISLYDLAVTNKNGSSGKGTGLFSVQQGGQPVCTLSPLPSAFSLVGTLNDGIPTYSGSMGTVIRARHVTLGGKDVLVVAVGSSNLGALQIFFLDPATGAVLDGTAIGTNTMPQPHITKLMIVNGTQVGTRALAMGDVNADGIPDIVSASRDNGVALAFVGSVDGNGILSYSSQIAFPATSGTTERFGSGLALGNLDGVPGDEVAVADTGFGSGQHFKPGGVFVYHYSGGGFTLYKSIIRSAASVAIGDVTGDSNNDLLIGGTAYPGPSLSNPVTFAAGGRVGVANVTGGAFLNPILGNVSGGTNAGVFTSPVSAGEQPAFTVAPLAGLDLGWLNDLDTGDINGDGLDDILIGVPNTEPSSACGTNIGTAYVYLTNPLTPDQPTGYALEPPTPGALYGWGIGAAAGTRLFFVGEIGRVINGVDAGQVWIYKVN